MLRRTVFYPCFVGFSAEGMMQAFIKKLASALEFYDRYVNDVPGPFAVSQRR